MSTRWALEQYLRIWLTDQKGSYISVIAEMLQKKHTRNMLMTVNEWDTEASANKCKLILVLFIALTNNI